MTPAPGWYLGERLGNCDTACNSHGLTCDEASLHSHNGDVDTSVEMLDILSGLGVSINSSCTEAVVSDLEYGPYVPIFNQEEDDYNCHYSERNRDLSTFDCSETPISDFPDDRRLCYCSLSPTGWYLGGTGVGCDTACHSRGLACDETTMHSRNSDGDTTDETIAVLNGLGWNTSSTCTEGYSSSPPPLFSPDASAISGASRAVPYGTVERHW